MDLNKIKQKFIDWTKLKVRHHIFDNEKEVYFREKEVWWAAIGKNVGYEVDGKQKLFERPVLILKKYNKDLCFILPLTSKVKEPLPWYQHVVIVEEKKSAVNITQGRSIGKERLLRRFGVVERLIFSEIINKFKKQFK